MTAEFPFISEESPENEDFFQNNTRLKAESVYEEEYRDSGEFDLHAFFETEENFELPDENESSSPSLRNLLVTLSDDANESIATFTAKVTAETFSAGASLTSSVFSALGSLAGSCGVICAHTLSSLGNVSSGISGVGGLSAPGLSVDSHGHFHLNGNIDSLSRTTGLSKTDLLSGKFSAEDIFIRFFSVFGEGAGLIFGFGVFDMVMDSLFESFIPGRSGGAVLSQELV